MDLGIANAAPEIAGAPVRLLLACCGIIDPATATVELLDRPDAVGHAAHDTKGKLTLGCADCNVSGQRVKAPLTVSAQREALAPPVSRSRTRWLWGWIDRSGELLRIKEPLSLVAWFLVISTIHRRRDRCRISPANTHGHWPHQGVSIDFLTTYCGFARLMFGISAGELT
jgi:hypothetical protein